MRISQATQLFEAIWNDTRSDDMFDRLLWKQHSYLKQIIEASYANMKYIEERLGKSVYAVLPDVIENTFGVCN